jgi:hypothetical protein
MTKLTICQEIAVLMAAENVKGDSTAKHILDKIQSIERAFKVTHDWANNTGQGVSVPLSIAKASRKKSPGTSSSGKKKAKRKPTARGTGTLRSCAPRTTSLRGSLQSMKNANNTSNSWTEKSAALDFKMKCIEHLDSLKSKKWGNKKIKAVFPELNP